MGVFNSRLPAFAQMLALRELKEGFAVEPRWETLLHGMNDQLFFQELLEVVFFFSSVHHSDLQKLFQLFCKLMEQSLYFKF